MYSNPYGRRTQKIAISGILSLWPPKDKRFTGDFDLTIPLKYFKYF